MKLFNDLHFVYSHWGAPLDNPSLEKIVDLFCQEIFRNCAIVFSIALIPSITEWIYTDELTVYLGTISLVISALWVARFSIILPTLPFIISSIENPSSPKVEKQLCQDELPTLSLAWVEPKQSITGHTHVGFCVKKPDGLYHILGLGDRGIYQACLSKSARKKRTIEALSVTRFMPKVSRSLSKKIEKIFFDAICSFFASISEDRDLKARTNSLGTCEIGWFPLNAIHLALFSFLLHRLPFQIWNPEQSQLDNAKRLYCSEAVYLVIHHALLEVNKFLEKEGSELRAELPGVGYEVLCGITPKRLSSLL